MSDNVKFVDHEEPVVSKVGKFLHSKGFIPASDRGMVAGHLLFQEMPVGVLWDDPELKPKKYLFGLIKIKPRRRFIGVIRCTKHHLATEQEWVFELYGRKYVDLVRQLTEDMAATFNVKIELSLKSEEPDVEKSWFWDD